MNRMDAGVPGGRTRGPQVRKRGYVLFIMPPKLSWKASFLLITLSLENLLAVVTVGRARSLPGSIVSLFLSYYSYLLSF